MSSHRPAQLSDIRPGTIIVHQGGLIGGINSRYLPFPADETLALVTEERYEGSLGSMRDILEYEKWKVIPCEELRSIKSFYTGVDIVIVKVLIACTHYILMVPLHELYILDLTTP